MKYPEPAAAGSGRVSYPPPPGMLPHRHTLPQPHVTRLTLIHSDCHLLGENGKTGRSAVSGQDVKSPIGKSENQRLRCPETFVHHNFHLYVTTCTLTSEIKKENMPRTLLPFESHSPKARRPESSMVLSLLVAQARIFSSRLRQQAVVAR